MCRSIAFFLIVRCISGSVVALSNEKLCGKRILIIFECPTTQKGSSIIAGGASEYKLALFKNLLAAGIDAQLLIVDFNDLQQSLQAQGLPVIGMITSSRQRRIEEIYIFLNALCQKEHIDLIHCHSLYEIPIVKKAAKYLGIKVITTLHGDNFHHAPWLKAVDGVIGVSSGIKKLLDQSNQTDGFHIENIAWIAPFFNEEKFLSFQPRFTKKNFFKENFGVESTDDPIICSIANFYTCSKNHSVLVKAVKKLKDVFGIKTQLMFAGGGKRLPEIRELVRKLGLVKNVHFLGHTDLVPELLYHSDINALTSDQESFGIALLEGALMKKPLVGTRGTGMEDIILHESTGLLFQKADQNDLTLQIKRLLDDHIYAAKLGNNAFQFVIKNYCMEVTTDKIIDFYDEILKIN